MSDKRRLVQLYHRQYPGGKSGACEMMVDPDAVTGLVEERSQYSEDSCLVLYLGHQRRFVLCDPEGLDLCSENPPDFADMRKILWPEG